MKKIKKNEKILADLEKNIDPSGASALLKPPALSKKNTTKFSMSNENEFLFNSRERQKSHKKSPVNKMQTSLRKMNECKAKSEEKYTGSPAYQIFMARNPEIQMAAFRFSTCNWEKKMNRQLNYINTPESASVRRFKKESYDNFDEFSQKKPRINIHKFEGFEDAERRVYGTSPKKTPCSDSEFMENPSKVYFCIDFIHFYNIVLTIYYKNSFF